MKDEAGIALVVALMALLLLTALGLALVLLSATETIVAANFRLGREALYAAEAGVERAMQDAVMLADWNVLLSGGATSSFTDGTAGDRTLPAGGRINIQEIINLANCAKTAACTISEMNTATADRPWGANNPRWQHFGSGRLDALLSANRLSSAFYVVVMAADDVQDGDGDPMRDSNGIATLRAEAFGPANAHRTIEATISRADAGTGGAGPPRLRVLSWREIR